MTLLETEEDFERFKRTRDTFNLWRKPEHYPCIVYTDYVRESWGEDYMETRILYLETVRRMLRNLEASLERANLRAEEKATAPYRMTIEVGILLGNLLPGAPQTTQGQLVRGATLRELNNQLQAAFDAVYPGCRAYIRHMPGHGQLPEVLRTKVDGNAEHPETHRVDAIVRDVLDAGNFWVFQTSPDQVV